MRNALWIVTQCSVSRDKSITFYHWLADLSDVHLVSYYGMFIYNECIVDCSTVCDMCVVQAGGADIDELLSTLWQSVRSVKQIICSFQLTTDVRSQAAQISALRDQVPRCYSAVVCSFCHRGRQQPWNKLTFR